MTNQEGQDIDTVCELCELRRSVYVVVAIRESRVMVYDINSNWSENPLIAAAWCVRADAFDQARRCGGLVVYVRKGEPLPLSGPLGGFIIGAGYPGTKR